LYLADQLGVIAASHGARERFGAWTLRRERHAKANGLDDLA